MRNLPFSGWLERFWRLPGVLLKKIENTVNLTCKARIGDAYAHWAIGLTYPISELCGANLRSPQLHTVIFTFSDYFFDGIFGCPFRQKHKTHSSAASQSYRHLLGAGNESARSHGKPYHSAQFIPRWGIIHRQAPFPICRKHPRVLGTPASSQCGEPFSRA